MVFGFLCIPAISVSTTRRSKESAPILINCIHIYLLFTARLMGTYFTYCGGRRIKNCKTKCTKKKKKKCFPCKHGNPPCCLLLLYLKKHVVQLSTSVKTIPFFIYLYFIQFHPCFLYHRTTPNISCFIQITFIT